MSKHVSTKKRTLLFVAFGWALLILGDRVGDLELYQGSFVATYSLAIN
jgi:branched-chain amino acid transport system permease protein